MRYIVIFVCFLSFTGCIKNQNKRLDGKPRTEIEGTLARGVERKYSAEGVLICETPFKNSKPDGLKKEFYSDGKLHRVTPCNMGVINGVVKEYYRSGSIYKETPTVNNKVEGIVTKYHQNGKKMSETIYRGGLVQMGLKEFDENGNKVSFPKLILKGKDKTVLDGTYIVELSTSNTNPNAEFGVVFRSKDREYLIPIKNENGLGYYKEIVPKGDIVMKKLTFETRFTTKYGNICILRDNFTIAVSNK